MSPQPKITDHYYPYLADGGEMGGLTRNYDWSKTSIGTPNLWPQSLLTTIGIILHSKFPMFLFWGPQQICFYNDAYRPSLGNDGKHPYALGKKAEEIWPEIWVDIKPLIDQVLAGGSATWSEDQLLPIYRNGQMEDVYWTFSYSPVIGEAGMPAGVFVTCVETTGKVVSVKKIEASENNLRSTILQAPAAMCKFKGPDFIVEIANELMLELWGKTAGDVMNKPIFEGLPEAKGQGFEELLKNVFTTGKTFKAYGLPVTLPRAEAVEVVYVNFIYEAYKEADGSISGVMAIANDVTEQVVARKSIEEAEEKARLAINSAGLGVYEISYTTNEMITDARFNEIWGASCPKTRSEYAAAIHADDKTIREEAHNTSLKTGNLNYEARIIGEDQSIHWVRVRGKLLFNNEGNPEKIIGVIQDITDQVIAHKKIEESEQRFQAAIAAVQGILWTNNSLGEMRGEQPGWASLTGQSFEEYQGFGWAKAVHPDDAGPTVDAWNEAVSEQKTFIFEHRVRKKNNEYGIFSIRTIPLLNAGGSIREWVGIHTDITVRKQAEEALLKITTRLHLALEAGKLGSYELDLTTGNIECTLQCKQNFGLDADSLLNLTGLFELIIPEDREILNTAIKHSIDNKANYNAEYRVLWKDGSVHWIYAAGIPVYDKENPVQITGVTADITEQKNFAEELKNKVKERTLELAEANLQLQQSNTELNQFAYIASHDLQEPLRKVRTFTQMMEVSLGEVSERTKNYMTKIQSSTERMQTLINDVLKFSLLSKEREKFERINLNNILKIVLSDYELSIEQKGAKITADILPVIEAIPLQMSQLFTNLLSNALKFADVNRPPEILVSSKELTNADAGKHRELDVNRIYYQLEFKDNGIGFSQEHALQIFTIFQRLHGKMEYEGTGIGLAMCKKIISNHHGIIYATSNLNEGSSFIIILPEVQ